MNCRWAWMLPVLSIATMLLTGAGAQGQSPTPAGPPPPGMMGPGGPSMMGPGMMGPSPGMYDPDSMGGMGMMGPGDGMGCPPGMDGGGGGGHGCNGLLGDILGIALPYADGGCAAPRWYDFEVGVITLKRDNAGLSQLVDTSAKAREGVDGEIAAMNAKIKELELRAVQLADDLLSERIKRVRVERQLILAKVAEAESEGDGN